MINHIGDADPLAARGLFPLKDDLNHAKSKKRASPLVHNSGEPEEIPSLLRAFLPFMSECTHDYCQ
ncbi:hypothetical protein [Paenibacillus sp. FSL K6-2862]|jgi:hypothetical protein|uniref:hypothetical protein n=1 Tax=Paenibacillus sp. FSL K6-2862 TaxID=2921484 RepID=UPI0011B59629